MPELLVLVRFDRTLSPDWSPEFGGEREGDGFLGGSLWEGLGEAETSLGLIHFADAAAGEAHLRRRIEGDGDFAAQPAPMTVRHLVIQSRHGKAMEATAVGSYLMTAYLIAAPGYGDVAGARIEETLEGIEAIEGYAGHVRGFNVALEDEIWALVFWNAPPVLLPPPDTDHANVERYRRVR